MEFQMIKRQSITVWLYTLKQAKNLKQYGSLHFVSKKLKYAVLYVDESLVESTCQALRKLPYVRDLELSHRDEIDMTFKSAIPDRTDPDLMVEEVKVEEEKNLDHFFKDLAQSIDHANHGDKQPATDPEN